MKKIKNIKIRMYRHGLGDCFLLTINYGDDGTYNMLIDCGVILGTENPQEKMTDVANDIYDVVGEEIDCVVITHEHWDHLSGFKQARDVFDKIKFKEVWMAWTEDPENKLANKLRKAREKKKKALSVAMTKLKDEVATNKDISVMQKTARMGYLAAVEEVAAFDGGLLGAAGSSSTKEALDYVKDKAGANLYYCYPGIEPFTIKDIDGLRIYVLGPPEDEKLIKKDLSTKEVYHSLFMSEVGNSFIHAVAPDVNEAKSKRFMPFDRYHGVSIEKVRTDNNQVLSYFTDDNKWRAIDNDWLDYSGQLALALDSDTNNTSLVMAIELIDSGKFLLFPGDAQVGNWLSWHNYKWKVKNNKNEMEEMDISKIFERTVFYKVGHHGSHNATLQDKGLEMMNNKELTVMIPVNKKMAKKKKWNMPFPKLLKRLKEKSFGRVILADTNFNAKSERPNSMSASEWAQYKKQLKGSGKLYFDYEIEA